MAQVLITEDSLSNIGNAIRRRTGSSELIKVDDMADAIRGIKLSPIQYTATINGTMFDRQKGFILSSNAVNSIYDTNINGTMFDRQKGFILSSNAINNVYNTNAGIITNEWPDELDILPMRPTVNNRYQYGSGYGWQQSYQDDGTLYGTSYDNVVYAIIFQINPNIYKRLEIEMAAGDNGWTYTQTHIRLCTDPTLSGWPPSSAGSGLLKQATLMMINRSVSTLQGDLESVGVTANITSATSLARQTIEWDISDLTDPFYLCFHRCRAWVRYYSIKAFKI